MKDIDIGVDEDFFREAYQSNLYDFWDEKIEPIMIETGTYLGSAVTAAMYKGVKTIHTIEIDKKLFAVNVNVGMENLRILGGHYETSTNPPKVSFYYDSIGTDVHYYFGDSCEVLSAILTINFNKKVFFWLDGHTSYPPEAEVACTPSPIGGNVPIFEEIDLISKHSIKNHTIIIDCDSPTTWDNELELKKAIKKINNNYKFIKAPRCVFGDDKKEKESLRRLEDFFGKNLRVGPFNQTIKDFVDERKTNRWDHGFVLIAYVEEE